MYYCERSARGGEVRGGHHARGRVGGGKGRQLGAGTATGLRVDLTSHTQVVGQSARRGRSAVRCYLVDACVLCAMFGFGSVGLRA